MDTNDSFNNKIKTSNESNQTVIVDVEKAISSSNTTAPLYMSHTSAGFPAPADDMVEKSLDINDLVVKHPASTFFVRVAGDSMEGVGIFNGDVLVVDRSIAPSDNKIVVAAIYGEMVVKRLSKKNGKAALYSENKKYKPIPIPENDDCFIWGVVVGSVRQF